MRRGALLRGIGAAGLAALAGCSPRRAAVHAADVLHGCVDTPVPSAHGVHVRRETFLSQYVPDAVRCVLVVPDGAGPTAVAYVLPGRGGTAQSALGLGLDGFLAEHLRRGGHPFALALVDAGESYFHARVSGEDRLSVATIELPRIVRDVLGTTATRREAIMGQSMGGYGALLAAEREPRRYKAVAVAGPAIFPSYEDEHRSVGDAFDSAADYARHDVLTHAAALRGKPVRIEIGRRDPFLLGSRMFAKACPTAEVIERAGCHDEGFWRTSASSLLSFVGSHL